MSSSIVERYKQLQLLINNSPTKNRGSIHVIANLCNARIKTKKGYDISYIDLSYSNFSNSNDPSLGFWHVDLEDADFSGANLVNSAFVNISANAKKYSTPQETIGTSFINFSGANLTSATFLSSALKGALFINSNLKKATIRFGNMEDADFQEAKLIDTKILNSDITGAKFKNADVTGLIYEPKAGTFPDLASISKAKNLDSITYGKTAAQLLSLKTKLNEAGFTSSARAINFAIKRTQIRRKLSNGNLGEKLKATLEYAILVWPSAWGYKTLRPLKLIALMILLCLPFHYWAIRKHKYYKVYRDAAKPYHKPDPKILIASRAKTVMYALYASLLSAFNIGWQGLEFRSWIQRLQPTESRLFPTGWARVFSGLQSLFSLFMIVTFLFSYFGKIF